MRCLECAKPTCTDNCPVGIDVKDFVQKIVVGDFLGAAAKIREANVLPAITGRVCPQEDQCEGKCLLSKKVKPLGIGYLERFVADADVGFHRAVFKRCGHEMLLNRLDALQVLSRRIVLTNQISSADAPTLIAQHEPIAEAVKLRDPELLEAAVRYHVIEAGELLMTRMAPLEAARSKRSDPNSFGLGRWPSGTTPHPRPGTAGRNREGGRFDLPHLAWLDSA